MVFPVQSGELRGNVVRRICPAMPRLPPQLYPASHCSNATEAEASGRRARAKTRKPGDLPCAVVLFPAGVCRGLRVSVVTTFRELSLSPEPV